jgi:hypothetical protein
MQAAIDWIKHAQDVSRSGGVAAGYTLGRGWGPPYPETTGYIIPTLLDYWSFSKDEDCKLRALRMARWLVGIQGKNGSIPDQSGAPVIFDTGQALQGIIRAYRETENEIFLDAAMRAGDFLVQHQETDGSWKRFDYLGFVHVYNTRVAWPLLELFGVTARQAYRDAARRSVEFAIANQKANGWFRNCAFTDRTNPLTHTIAYTIQGILECGVLEGDNYYLAAARRAADALLSIFEKKLKFSGTYDENWSGKDRYDCLTGNAQISLTWMRLFEIEKNNGYLECARELNNCLKWIQSKHLASTNMGVRGAIPGSDPIYGNYMRLGFPNWATKFFIDALLTESRLGMIAT